MQSNTHKNYSRARNAVISVYDSPGNVIETHEHKGDFKEPRARTCLGFRFVSLKTNLRLQSSDEIDDLPCRLICPLSSVRMRRRVFGSADRSGADRTWDQAGAAQE